MADLKRLHFKKLSTKKSIALTELSTLRNLIQESKQVATDLSLILSNLREVPPQSNTQVNISTFNQKLSDNLEQLKKKIGTYSDWIIRPFSIGKNSNIHLAIIYINDLADKKYIQQFIFELTTNLDLMNPQNTTLNNCNTFEYIKSLPLSGSNLTEITNFDALCLHVLSGDTIIMLDGYSQCLVLSTKGGNSRGVEEPSNQTVLRGPKDGFTEVLETNKALIRKRIKDNNLQIENRIIGTVTKTSVATMYIKGICDDNVVEDVRSRLEKIEIKGIFESGNIEELIQDAPFSVFPTILNTERPDTVAAELLQGRIAILVDGTPFVLIVPAVFVQFFHASEDFYHSFIISSLVRLLRYFSFFLSMLVPSIYIALTTFHQEMLPTPLLINIAAQREGVPFPAFVEALMMEVTFEILREAGIRMPRAVGSSISIVGALVLGQASVEAGIISAAVVIVVSITAISSLILPHYNMSIAIRILRFVFIFLAASFGLYGVFIGLILLLLHLCNLRSFGIPYMSPLAPFAPQDQKDGILRFPLWFMNPKPTSINKKTD